MAKKGHREAAFVHGDLGHCSGVLVLQDFEEAGRLFETRLLVVIVLPRFRHGLSCRVDINVDPHIMFEAFLKSFGFCVFSFAEHFLRLLLHPCSFDFLQGKGVACVPLPLDDFEETIRTFLMLQVYSHSGSVQRKYTLVASFFLVFAPV